MLMAWSFTGVESETQKECFVSDPRADPPADDYVPCGGLSLSFLSRVLLLGFG